MQLLFVTLVLGPLVGGAAILPPVVSEPVRGTLVPGQVHSEELTLEASQRIHLRLEQAHLDVEVRVIRPDGTILGSVDNAVARSDPLTLTLLTTSAGLHRIEVRLARPTSASGAFRLFLDPPGPPSPIDPRRMEAERLRAQADRRALQQEAPLAPLAREEYQQSAAIWRELSEPRELAATLGRHAQLLEHLGELEPARSLLEEALVLWRQAGDPAGEVDCLDGLGLLTTELGDPSAAVKLLEQALEMRRRLGPDPVSEGSILNDLAVALGNLGELPEAIRRYTEALEHTRRAGDLASEANVLKNRATDLAALGQFERALADLREAKVLYGRLRDPGGEAISNFGIGNTLSYAHQDEEALRYYRLALPVLERAGDERFAAFTLDRMGLCHLALHRYDEANHDFQVALEKLDRANDKRGAATTRMNLARTLLERGRPGEALEGLRGARDTLHELGDKAHEAEALTHMARAERALGQLDQARQHILQALQLVEQTRSSIVGSTARAAYLATQHHCYELLVGVLMDLHRRWPDAGWDAEAFRASESARARSLLELLADAQVDIRRDVPEKLREEEQALRGRIDGQRREQQRVLSHSHTAAEADRLERTLEQLEGDWEMVQSRMRASSARYETLTSPFALSLEQVRTRVLDPDSVLLEYFLGEEGSYAWVLSPHDLVSARLPGREVLERAASRLYRTWSDPSGRDEGRSAAQAFSRMVLGPLVSAVTDKRLLVVADGALQQIPFGALLDPRSGQPLLLQHEVVSLPSASTVALLRRPKAARTAAGAQVAILADPVFDVSDPRLGGKGHLQPAQLPADLLRSLEDTGLHRLERLAATGREAQSIVARAGVGKSFSALGFLANRPTALGADVAAARVVHLASHALLDPKRPELSGIVLSLLDAEGKPQDGFLAVGDVSRMRLEAELVVLSACRTGLGKEVRGEGLLGLTRAFMHAGAPRVVASLWRVSDQATAALMDRFYQALLVERVAPAAALRSAQLALRSQRRFSAPFAWAGFVLQGDWTRMSEAPPAVAN
jgi:CHAT domain-containing protein/tetratricopeptide (TPR) repeat protein